MVSQGSFSIKEKKTKGQSDWNFNNNEWHWTEGRPIGEFAKSPIDLGRVQRREAEWLNPAVLKHVAALMRVPANHSLSEVNTDHVYVKESGPLFLTISFHLHSSAIKLSIWLWCLNASSSSESSPLAAETVVFSSFPWGPLVGWSGHGFLSGYCVHIKSWIMIHHGYANDMISR